LATAAGWIILALDDERNLRAYQAAQLDRGGMPAGARGRASARALNSRIMTGQAQGIIADRH
jgi:hypothetical protein